MATTPAPTVKRPAPPSAAAPPAPLWRRLAGPGAVVSGVFCLAMAAALAVAHVRHQRATDPLDHPRILSLKDELIKQPRNDALKKEIQALDLELRIAHDRYLARLSMGRWALLGGMAVFLASLQAATWRSKIARPGKVQKAPGWQAREILRASAAVAMLGLVAAGGVAWMSSSSDSLLKPELARAPAPPTNAAVVAVPTAPAPPATPFPAAEEVARNWGAFRGPGGAGVAAFTNLPLTWNVQTGENVLWKSKAPGPDFNSPVAWGNRIFLTTATAKKREVCCYDAATGALLWQKALENVPQGGAAVDLPEISGGHACPTAATDGRRVYAIFANGDLGAFDYAGNVVWSRSFAPIKNQYGHAASLALWQDRLLIQLDHGESDEILSRLVAVNTADGKTVWEKKRETHGTWSSPIAVELAGKPQVITLGLPHVIAYSATDGAELWRAEGIDGEITPSPIVAAGLVLAPSPSTKLLAIKPDGTGDVTKTHVPWFVEEGVPDITSPVSDGQRVYLLTTGGGLTAWDLKDGKRVWEKDLEMEFKASPSLVGDRLYLPGSKGVMVVAAAGPEFKELARSDLADEIAASPAFLDGSILIRSKQHLWRFGAKKN